MEYIISPMWFYAVQVCDTMSIFLVIVGAIALLFCPIAGFYIWADSWGEPDETEEKMLKTAKRGAIIGAILIIIGLLLPREETLIKMQIAKFGTKDNVETVLKVIDKKTDDLIDAIAGSEEEE